jgi:hypothetical protein
VSLTVVFAITHDFLSLIACDASTHLISDLTVATGDVTTTRSNSSAIGPAVGCTASRYRTTSRRAPTARSGRRAKRASEAGATTAASRFPVVAQTRRRRRRRLHSRPRMTASILVGIQATLSDHTVRRICRVSRRRDPGEDLCLLCETC